MTLERLTFFQPKGTELYGPIMRVTNILERLTCSQPMARATER